MNPSKIVEIIELIEEIVAEEQQQGNCFDRKPVDHDVKIELEFAPEHISVIMSSADVFDAEFAEVSFAYFIARCVLAGGSLATLWLEFIARNAERLNKDMLSISISGYVEIFKRNDVKHSEEVMNIAKEAEIACKKKSFNIGLN